MTYESFSELLEELTEAGVNPHNDIGMCKHYIKVHNFEWSDNYYEDWKILNPNPEIKRFKLL